MTSIGAKFVSLRSSFVIFCLALLLLLCAPRPLAAQVPALDAEEQMVLKLINDYRGQNGLTPLRVSLALTRAADWMSADMAAQNYFNHTDSQGRDPFTRMAAFGYNYPSTRGENIAAGYNDAARTFNLWRTSPSHNAAMLNPAFNVIGISRAYNQLSIYRWYWTTDFGSFVDTIIDPGTGATQELRTVNAASYAPTIAPDAIATAFGNQLSAVSMAATSLPLPTSMAGVSVTVNGNAAPLLFISPTQVNYLVPTNVDPGAAVVRVLNNGSVITTGTVNVETISPGVFTFLSSGKGLAAAQTTFDGASFTSVGNSDGSTRPVSVGTVSRPNFLVLYGTGLRRRSSLSNVRVTIGGLDAPVQFLGAHSRYAGMDQLNVKLPQELRGRGLVDVVVTVDGRVANTVNIEIGQ